MHVHVKVVKLGRLHVAATVLGGVTVRGRSAEEAGDAIRNLFWKLAGQDHDDDAKLAVELAANGVNLDTELKAIEDGGGK